MAAIFKYYLDERAVEAGSQAPLKIYLNYNRKVIYIPLGIKLLHSQWDVKRSVVIRHESAAHYNVFLKRIAVEIEREFLRINESQKLQKPTVSEIKETIIKMIDPVQAQQRNKEKLFKSRIEKYIDSKDNESTRNIYRNTLNLLTKFDKHLDTRSFDDINAPYLNSFVRWMRNDKVEKKQNTINIHLRNIRAIFNAAIDDDITSSYPFQKVKIKDERTPDRSLTVNQFRHLISYPVAEWQREYIDMFALIFMLRGINIGDLALLDHINGDRVEYYRQKTGKLYSVKLEPEALDILSKYRGRKKLLSILDRYEDYRDYAKHMNNGLKSVGLNYENGKKYSGRSLFPDITTYWARYTWASVAAELDIPRETIAAGLGHSWADVTAVYIRNDMKKKVDEANRKVIDFVLYGKDWREEQREELRYAKLMLNKINIAAQ